MKAYVELHNGKKFPEPESWYVGTIDESWYVGTIDPEKMMNAENLK
jgi:hypothetical protein